METAPKSIRLQLGLFGRTNVGKSSFLNMVTGQDVAVTSPIPGTTTDVVEKPMELLPIGPIVFLDTAGVDDVSELAGERLKKTAKIYDRADIFVLVTESNSWTTYEESILSEARKREVPAIVVVNKTDLIPPYREFLGRIKQHTAFVTCCSSIDTDKRDRYVTEFKSQVTAAIGDAAMAHPTLIGDLLPAGGLAVLIVPIDLQAPKGRLILPQVQTIRDALDNDAAVLVVKEREYASYLSTLGRRPNIVVCDSQVVQKMVADTPPDVPCTTFSILFGRLKGDLATVAQGAAHIDSLKSGDKILIGEACSHHAAEDDIGRVKIPRWLRQYTGVDLNIDVVSGRDYPDNLTEYKLVIHCGACMLTRREMLVRIRKAREAGVPVTNYGVGISVLQGVIQRVLTPFPAALDAYTTEYHRLHGGLR